MLTRAGQQGVRFSDRARSGAPSVSVPVVERPHVLHLLACDDWGGTEVQVAAQVVRWGDVPGTQTVAFLQPPGPILRLLRGSDCRAVSVAGRGGVAGAVVRLARLLRREGIDFIEAYGLRAGLVARAVALLGGRPAVVIGIRSPHFSQGEPGALRTRAVIGSSDSFCAPSPPMTPIPMEPEPVISWWMRDSRPHASP